MKGYELFFQAYHEGELWDISNLEIDGVRIHKVWDSWNDNVPMEEAKIPDEMVEAFYQSRITLNSNRSSIPEKDRPKILVDAPELEREGDVYLLSIGGWGNELERFKQHLLGPWALHLLAAEGKRGADDGTYDYYPDLWFISRQLFNALGMQKEYNNLRDELFRTTDYGNPDGDLMELIPAAEDE